MKYFCWIFLLWIGFAHSFDSSGEFNGLFDDNLSVSGMGGFYSTPARKAEPAMGVQFSRVNSLDQTSIGIAGNFGGDEYGCGFYGAYDFMDSIYRRVYSEWNLSFFEEWFVVGAGYGVSMEWVPADAWWNRHRYKAGTSLVGRWWSISAMGWNYFSEGLQRTRYLFGFQVNPENSFDCFFQWDGISLFTGYSLNLKYLSLSTVYRFPNFAAAMTLNFHFDLWSIGGSMGKSDESLEWFKLDLKKKVSKKTIL